ncbi:MAG: type II toxin-antitoxin system HigB family toxin [Acidobacteria bacterium]|nr:type II toxin-antitoxin system HigB family toxin [Acidobacteriota bacterium]MBV9145842.1 type II toxin-antitoxin system HigB family toxin [Acidobacteriota bacterium]MBV9438024.1 type II toxin-antitoxin system HigB family toxin [Acidobacteriota bacterium]
MRIIRRSALVQFWSKHPNAKSSLESWYAVMRAATWRTPADLKNIYPNADFVGRRTVFNIGGNKYRLIARVNYTAQRIFVLYLLTHAEYDRGDWKR